MSFSIRLFLSLFGLVLSFAFYATGRLGPGDIATSAILAAFLFPFLWLPFLVVTRVWQAGPATGLERVMVTYPTGDTLTLGDWHRGISIYGGIGTGKSSSSGLVLARAAVGLPNSSGCIFASNPDDERWWTARFVEAGRLADLKVFSKAGEYRWNTLDSEQKAGADSRDLTSYLMTVGESLVESKGGKDDQFWKMMQERYLFCAIEAVRQGRGQVDSPSLARFFATAAYSRDQLKDDDWRAEYHNQTLKAAHGRPKDSIEEADYQIIKDMFLGEFPNTDDRVRMSVLAGINNTLHALNSGIVREIISTGTNASAEDYASGIWHLFNFPVTQFGSSGKAIYASAKFSAERWVLRRDYQPGDPTVTLWGDEFWHIVNSGDVDFMSEARKHGGTIVALTQSLNNYAIALGDSADKRRAEAFSGLFATKIFHAVDLPTAQFASGLCGSGMQKHFGGSMPSPKDIWEQIQGNAEWTGNVNESVRPFKEPFEFMHGLRTGGKRSKMFADSWVVRSGDSFRDRSNVIFCPWSQK